jgi:hypothetical protein
VGVHHKPQREMEAAVDVGIEAIREHLKGHGLTLRQVLVTVRVTERPAGGDCVTGFDGYDGPLEMVADLVGYIGGLGAEIGLELRVITADQIGEG